MDWFSWLSKSGLEPSLTYEYGLAFSRNELQPEDLTYFNHEFLQSMGISVAKHRIEILKLARKDIRGSPHTLSRLILAINKSKRCFSKYINRWFFHEDTALELVPEPSPYRKQWRGALSRKEPRQEMQMLTNRSKWLSGPLDRRVEERFIIPRSPRMSGPLDRRVQDRLMLTNRSPRVSGLPDGKIEERLIITNRSPRLSGPLDRRVQDRLMLTNGSPRLCGPQDGRVLSPKVYSLYSPEMTDGDDGIHSIWASLFQDMKPT